MAISKKLIQKAKSVGVNATRYTQSKKLKKAIKKQEELRKRAKSMKVRLTARGANGKLYRLSPKNLEQAIERRLEKRVERGVVRGVQRTLAEKRNNRSYLDVSRSQAQYKNLATRNFVLERDVLKKYGIKADDTIASISEKLNVRKGVVKAAVTKARARNASGRLIPKKVISVRTGQPEALRFYRKITSKRNPTRGFKGGISRRVSIRCGELSRAEILTQIKRMTGQGPNVVAYKETKQLVAPPFGQRKTPKIIETEPVDVKLGELGPRELCTWARKVAMDMQNIKNQNVFGYKKIKHWGTKQEIATRKMNRNKKEELQQKRRNERERRLKQYRKQRAFKEQQDEKYRRNIQNDRRTRTLRKVLKKWRPN